MVVKLEAPGRENEEDGERTVVADNNKDWQENSMKSQETH